MAGLLDHVGIEKAAVMGASGGGPTAYLFAARHQDRVSCLVQIDAICQPVSVSVTERLFSTAVGAAASIALMKRAPRVFVRMVLGRPPAVPSPVMASRARAVLEDRVHMAGLQALFQSAYSHWPARRSGYRNDVDLVTRLGLLPLEEIACRTLIVHGTADTSVPPGQAEHAHARIPGSELYWVKDGEHVGALLNEQDQAQKRITEWLRAQAREPAP